jgi:hypothetical protein
MKFLWITVGLLASCFPALPQKVDVASIVQQFSSPDWKLRSVALHEMLATSADLTAGDVQSSEIGLLERENQIRVSEDTDYQNYLSDLQLAILRIAQDSNSARAYTALLDSSFNADSTLGKAIANDRQAFSLITSQAGTAQGPKGHSLVLLLGEALYNRKTSRGPVPAAASESDLQYRAAKGVLVQCAQNDSDIGMRIAAIGALGTVGDQTDLPLLRSLADEAKGQTDEESSALRKTARRVLAAPVFSQRRQ